MSTLLAFTRRLLGLPTGHQITLDGEDCGYAVLGLYGDGTYYGDGAGDGFKMEPYGAMVFSVIFGDGDSYGDGDGDSEWLMYE